MVQEVRKIIFSRDELLGAFEGYGRMTPQFLPGGKLLSCAPVEPDGVMLKIEMSFGSTSHEAEFIYRGMDVLRPLILYCIESNIMLPREGRKSYSSVNGQPAMTVELDLDRDTSTLVAPMMGEHIRLLHEDPASQKVVTLAPTRA